MENCSIYSHKIGFEPLVKLVKEKFPGAKIQKQEQNGMELLELTFKKGFLGKKETLKLNYRERLNPSYQLEKVEGPFTQNLAGMANFIAELPAENKGVQQQLIYKVCSINSEIAFMAYPKISKHFEQLLKEICEQYEALVFAYPNSLFKASTQNYFADQNLNLVLDPSGRSGVKELEVRVDAKYYELATPELSKEQKERKAKSESILKEKGIKINPHLPPTPNEEEVELRTVESISDRIYALLIIAAKATGIGKKNLDQFIEDKKITHFSPFEEELLNKELLEAREKAYASWRYESLYLLLWSVGLLPELSYPSEACDVQRITAELAKMERNEIDKIMHLRSKKEILDALDLIYRMNWACIDARIKEEAPGGELNPSIIYERHYALNWLINYQNLEWDFVRTDT